MKATLDVEGTIWGGYTHHWMVLEYHDGTQLRRLHLPSNMLPPNVRVKPDGKFTLHIEGDFEVEEVPNEQAKQQDLRRD